MALDKTQVSKMIAVMGEEAAKAFMIEVGITAEAADKEILDAAKMVKDEEVKTVLKGFKDSISEHLINFATENLLPLIPDNLTETHFSLCFTSEEIKGKNDAVIQAGFYVSKIGVKREGDERWTNISDRVRQPRSGNGGGAARAVPIPTDAPFGSWAGFVEMSSPNKYHQDKTSDDKASYIPLGDGYAATTGLKKVKDELYAACQNIKTDEDRAATWEEVKEFA